MSVRIAIALWAFCLVSFVQGVAANAGMLPGWRAGVAGCLTGVAVGVVAYLIGRKQQA